MARRKAKKRSVSPLLKPAVVGAVVVLGVVLFVGLRGSPADVIPDADLPIERRVNQTQTYARGDDQLRMMLSQ